MNNHENARLTPRGRELLVRQIMGGQTLLAAARAANVCPRTARRWLARLLAEGVDGLRDRSSTPHRLHRPMPPGIAERVDALRRQRWTGRQIAAELDISPATVSRILKRLGLNRLAALEPAEPVRRHERDTPGDLVASGSPKTRRPGAGPGLQVIAHIALFLVAGTRSHLNLLFDAPGLAT